MNLTKEQQLKSSERLEGVDTLNHSSAYSTRSLEEEILATKSKPGLGVVFSLLLITIVLAYFAYDSTNLIGLGIWVSAMTILMILRITFQRPLAKDSSIPIEKRMRYTLYLTGAAGLVHASSFFFTPGFSLTEKTIQTIMILGLANGAISTNSGYRPFFLAYSLPVMIGVTLAWSFIDLKDGNQVFAYVTAVLNSVYFGVMYLNASNHFKFFKESYQIRSQQSEFNSKLAKKNAQLDIALNQALEARKDADMANKSKTRFLASASHDLRQPTHALSLLAGVLTRQELDKKSMSIALDIHQASQNLQALMTGLLDISKLDAGLMVPRIEAMDLIWLITRVCNEFEAQAYDKGLRLMFISNYGSASTRSDPQLTERILRNLVSNAVKYTESGKVEVLLDKDEEQWLVSIKDTGCGIAPQEHEKIFEEFYQIGNAHRDSLRGLGLGLAIVKRLSDTLNLDLNCDSTLNEGSTFSFKLPVISEKKVEAHKKTNSDSLKGLHILCVDDEHEIRRAMSLVFELLECSFDLVEGVDEAIEAAHLQKPDIVLADYRLVGERNGIDTIHAIREVYPDIPALLVTGDTSPKRLKLASDAKIEMLHKPLTMEKLVAVVGAKLKEKK